MLSEEEEELAELRVQREERTGIPSVSMPLL